MSEIAKKIKSPEFWKNVEFNRFGIMPLTITAQSCMGSIAVFFILKMTNMDIFVPLLLVAYATMGANAITISGSPMKWVLGSFVVSILVSIIFIIVGISVG